MKQLKILIVDDAKAVREMLKMQLEEYGYEVVATVSGDEAVEMLKHDAFDLAITDLMMPGNVAGIRLLEIIKEKYRHMEVIIMTGRASVETAIEALKKGAVDYFTKPYRLEELLICVERVARKKEVLSMLKHVEQDKEKGVQDLVEIISVLSQKCNRVEKVLCDKKQSESNRIQTALKILSEKKSPTS